MAMATTTSHAPLGAETILRLVNGIQGLTHAVVAWNDARVTRKILLNLSIEQLQDAGLTRTGRA